MKSISLYNQDGSLCSEAQLLIYPKPDDISMVEWRKRLKNFRAQLSAEDLKEFNKLKVVAWRIKWRADNHKRIKENRAKWRKGNPKYQLYQTKYKKERRARDPLYCFYENIRRSSNRVVKQLALGNKPTNTLMWLGCSQKELKAHFESLFTEGMTWENYGEWHVDHIRPVSSFVPEEWEQINHYTNLQPLWAKDNLLKGDSWEQ
jgi:hypothetical protein